MRPVDIAQLVLLAAIWGSSYLLIKVALEDLTPLHIVAGRLILGALFLLALVRFTGRKLPERMSTWRSLALMAVVANVIPFGLITWGEQEISSSLAAILNSTTPLFTAALASFFIAGERVSATRALGISLGFIGVVTIVGIDTGGGLTGEIAVVAASLSYAVGFVFARRHLTGGADGAITLSAGQLLLSSAITVPWAVGAWVVDPPTPRGIVIACVAALGIAGTGLGFVLYYRLVASVGATSASLVNYLLPPFGVLMGALVLDEELGFNTLVGALLVIAGIALAQRRTANRAPLRTEARDASKSASTRSST